MAIVKVKIHPALGIARVGNSPEEYFIGPERPLDRSIPEGGYKDNQCRVKRQAARFRIFTYHDDGTATEITEKKASISWTVYLANKKAAVRNRNPVLRPEDPAIDPVDLIIDPGPRTLTGPDKRQLFDTGQIKLPGAASVRVPLGEARTDNVGRLLILGGFGRSDSPTSPPTTIAGFYDNAGWYDDTSDGKITATIQIRETGETFAAEGAWVVVAPPKFAPGIDNVITLYDRLFDMAVKEKWIKEPDSTSYSEDIYPILQRARTTKWVQNPLGAHTWPDPVVDPDQRSSIFFKISYEGVGGNMPLLYNASLTENQFKHLEKWKEGTFVNDWTGPPLPPATITPEGLDKAALENAVGSAFWPGIEVGGISERPIDKPSNYVVPFSFRLNHDVLKPGDVTAYMALPWQADFFDCGGWDGVGKVRPSWWPVPRPIQVIPQGEVNYQVWNRDVGNYDAMVKSWHTLGFVIKQGDQYVEVDRCAGSFVTLLTPNLDFHDISEGPMGTSRMTTLAILFEVKSTVDRVTLEIQASPKHHRLVPLNKSVTVGPTIGNNIVTAEILIRFETGSVGETLNDQVVICNPANGQTWTVPITGNTVRYEPIATALVLDRSGSMSKEGADAKYSKYKNLQEAVSIFFDTMLEGNGIATICFNDEVQILQDLIPTGSFGDHSDISRSKPKNILLGQQNNPTGGSSIGAGILEGLRILNANPAKSAYGTKSIIVLTDGRENREPWIANVAREINHPIYSICIGLVQNTSASTLQAISVNSGGYSLMTEEINNDKHFKLTKYLLQILASISNAEVVTNSNGDILPGVEYRIPFTITESDTAMDVILLGHSQQFIDFRLQTPNGFIVEPSQSGENLLHVLSDNVSYYRIILPIELQPMRFDRAGTWHVLLRMRGTHRATQAEPTSVIENMVSHKAVSHKVKLSQSGTIPYGLLVHAYSNLTLSPSLQQSNYEPGSLMSLRATIYESGLPLPAGKCSIWVDITTPDSSHITLPLKEDYNSQFGVTFRSSIPGIYQFRIRANGRSKMGYPFQREKTLTGAVWYGGDNNRDFNNTGKLARLTGEQD